MPERNQISLFDSDNQYYCDRWFRYDACWNCSNFINNNEQERHQICMERKCGTCMNCELPKGKYFVGCAYAEPRYKG